MHLPRTAFLFLVLSLPPGLLSGSGAASAQALAARADDGHGAGAAPWALVSPEKVRTFAEPLIAVGPRDAGETAELAEAIEAYRAAADVEAVQPILQFLGRHPDSAWKPSLLANLAVLYRHTGYIERSLESAGEAWRLTRQSADPDAKKVADGALASYLDLTASLGRTDELAALLAGIGNRPLTGHAAEVVSGARSSLWQMRHDPGSSFRCGPLAVERVGEALHPGEHVDPRVLHYPSTRQGTSLAELEELARRIGLDLRPVHRAPGSLIPVPAVVHWKAGHFAAVVARRGDRFLVRDLTFGEDRWLSRAAVEEESSGYLLAARQQAPEDGWRRVGASEAAGVRGRGASTNPNPGATTPDDPKKPVLPGDCGGSDDGMPRYNFHTAVVSLNVTDTPVAYTPPRGPAIRLGVTYNSREDFQPATFTFTNLGSRWSFNWLSYIEDDDPNGNGGSIRVAERGGGSYVLPQLVGGEWWYFQTNVRGAHDTVSRIFQTTNGGAIPIGFVRQFPDGSQEIYELSDNAATMRKYFLTSVIDPAGNTVTLTYDAATTRLLIITDPLGQQTTLSYGLPGDIYKVTAVTDPFGRQAVFQYAGGELESITDAMGLTSTFGYGPTQYDANLAADFINAMTTPYGTTTFDMGEMPPSVPSDLGNVRWLLATDPLGNSERIEFIHEATGISQTTSEAVPAGFPNENLAYRNTFYWNPIAMQQYSGSDPNRYLNASYLQHWLRDGTGSVVAASSILESEQAQGQHRIWYSYPGEPQPTFQGTLSAPTIVAQVLDSGQQQIYQQSYDTSGRLLAMSDPAGRTFSFHYAANGIDLASITNTLVNGGEQVAAFTYNSAHRPLTYTDYSGQTYTASYNSFGEMTSLTRPDGVSTSLAYDAQGFLQQIARIGTSYQETFTWDAANRLHTWTSTDGYTLTFSYDNLDRMTSISYPDGTSESVVYNRRDVIQYQDRMGRVTSFAYDAADRKVSAIDPAGRTTTYSWCGCGALDQMTDPLGHQTAWFRDDLDRVIGKQVNGQVSAIYGYDGSGRLISRTDGLGQVTSYSYYVDNSLAAVAYQNAVHPTPGVQYQYDPFYPRLAMVTDGFGTTAYSYNPAGVAGAGQVASVTAPAPAHTVTYQYDAVGRRTGVALDGVSQTRTFDTEGRVASYSNPLGTFPVAYGDSTARPAWVVYPNKQSVTYYWDDAMHDHQLGEIRWGPLNSFNLSQFNYTYDAAHDQVVSMTWYDINHQSGAYFNFTYDGAKELLSRQQTTNPAQSPVTVLHTNAFGYDPAGNRTSEAIDSTLSVATYDGANQLIAVNSGLAQQAALAIGARRRAESAPVSAPPQAVRTAGGGRHEN